MSRTGRPALRLPAVHRVTVVGERSGGVARAALFLILQGVQF
jgi:hypothetical protein